MATRYRISKQIKFNLKSFLEKELINDGLYFNVSSGTIDVQDNLVGTLKRVNSTTYESYFDRWIYESDASGVSPYTTTVASGVYVNGTFHAKGAAPYSPSINYNEGKVTFGSGVPDGATVAVDFSYKHVVVDFPKSNIINLLYSSARDMVDFTTHAYPSGNQRQVPRLVIDLQKGDDEPFAIGGPKQYNQQVVFHILTNTTHELDQIVDILREKLNRIAIVGVDFNKVPQILDYKGDKASTYMSYTDLQNNSLYTWVKLYVEDPKLVKTDMLFNYHRARVDWKLTLIL
jgi:hypothetical protein